MRSPLDVLINNCMVVLDPNPRDAVVSDALVAGSEFFYCHCFRPSGVNVEESHAHVLGCPENPGNNLFVEAENLAPVHQQVGFYLL